MRQVGQLASERDAQKFAAWLVTQQIDALAEHEGDHWSIWVRDEDQLAQAKTAFDQFQAQPSDPRYADAEKLADAVRRQVEAKREQARSRAVQMRDRWGKAGAAGPRRSPVVLFTIGLCVLIFIATDFGKSSKNSFYQLLSFTHPTARDIAASRAAAMQTAGDPQAVFDAHITWASIRRGEIWRLVTPALMHGSFAHILLNMYWLYMIGTVVEDRYGSLKVLLLMLVLAVTSNVGQAVVVGPFFLGMSGVGYGIFGFAWMRAKYDPASGIRLDPGTVFIMMLWLVLCILADMPPFDALLGRMLPTNVANTAHVVGLVVGMLIGYPWYKHWRPRVGV
jgi:GlpG protein